MAADNTGAIYHEKLLSADDLIEFLPKMIELQDEPIADPVCVPLYYVSKLAKENEVTVCQVERAQMNFFGVTLIGKEFYSFKTFLIDFYLNLYSNYY